MAAPPVRRSAAAAQRARRTQLTVRAGVLAVAIVSVALTLAVPFKVWLSQRSAIDAAIQHNAATRKHVVALEHAERQWKNPAFIEREASKRLHYVRPGQTAYVVDRSTTGSRQHHTVVVQRPSDQPWWSQLWSPTG